jgi:hypothetical protein
MVDYRQMKPLRFRTQFWLFSGLVAVCAIGFTESGLLAALPENPSDELSQPLYAPPKKFTPRARVGGDVRGTEGTDPEVKALVPDHVGYTVKETPAVNWFMSKTTVYQVRHLYY